MINYGNAIKSHISETYKRKKFKLYRCLMTLSNSEMTESLICGNYYIFTRLKSKAPNSPSPLDVEHKKSEGFPKK